MEFLLLWWDDLDDLTHACRHLAGSAVAEVATLSAPAAGALSALLAWAMIQLQR